MTRHLDDLRCKARPVYPYALFSDAGRHLHLRGRSYDQTKTGFRSPHVRVCSQLFYEQGIIEQRTNPFLTS